MANKRATHTANSNGKEGDVVMAIGREAHKMAIKVAALRGQSIRVYVGETLLLAAKADLKTELQKLAKEMV